VTLTPSRVPGTRYSQPLCQPTMSRPKATRPWNEPASTITQNNTAGIIAATVSVVSLARARPVISAVSVTRPPALWRRRRAADHIAIVTTTLAMLSPTHTPVAI